jgi:hypothetical protein
VTLSIGVQERRARAWLDRTFDEQYSRPRMKRVVFDLEIGVVHHVHGATRVESQTI